MSDVSRAALTERLAQHQAALSEIPYGIGFFDRESRLFYHNKAYSEIYALVDGKRDQSIAPIEAPSTTRSGESSDHAVLPDGRHIQITRHPMPDGGWLEIHDDVSARRAKSSEESARLSLQSLVDRLPYYLWVKDRDCRFVVVNKALALDCGRELTSDMIGLNDFDLHPYDAALEFRTTEIGILRNGSRLIDREEMVFDNSGNRKWLSSTKVPLYDEHDEIIGIIGCAKDITAEKLATRLLDEQAKLFESMATNVPLPRILNQIAVLIEYQMSGIYCVITMLGKDGTTLRCRAAPGLSETFAARIDGMPIGPEAPSCGVAAYEGRSVFVADMLSDPAWGDYRSLMEDHELRSCWSMPILSRGRKTLGTVAMYGRIVRQPADDEVKLAELAAHLAAIAMEQHILDKGLRTAVKPAQAGKEAGA